MCRPHNEWSTRHPTGIAMLRVGTAVQWNVTHRSNPVLARTPTQPSIGGMQPIASRHTSDPPPAPPRRSRNAPKLLDQVRRAIRVRHYSRRTEKTYVGWIRRYVRFHGTRHPGELGAEEVSTFLSSLATRATSRRINAGPGCGGPCLPLPSRPRARPRDTDDELYSRASPQASSGRALTQ